MPPDIPHAIIALAMARFGIEEEVFITEPERPNLRSLYYLAKLLARNPLFYYTHSAHNFARGKDLRIGLMSGVEISTATHTDPDSAVDDLAQRRADLAKVTSGLIVPVGHLLDMDAPSNTCGMHVHIDGVADKRRLYCNLIHFLPILCLFTINSPMALRRYFGKSYRMYKSFAIGPIREDWTFRFQDVILSKRLKTIELRVCDPCWDLNRVRYLLRAVAAIAELDETLDPNIKFYNDLRERICQYGLLDETAHLVDKLKSLIDFPTHLITRTASDELREIYDSCGLVGAYSALDNGYRNGCLEPREVRLTRKSQLGAAIVGFAGYFIPRLPFYALKGLREM